MFEGHETKPLSLRDTLFAFIGAFMDKPAPNTFLGDTIFSLSSAGGQAGVSVFRISGPQAAQTLKSITGRPLPKARYAALRKLWDSEGALIDEALTLWFPAPYSFTGEDCAEFQTHGSLAVIEGLSQALLNLGLQQAEPGEFTRRAVENGKMDLTAAEGLADLIDAQTKGQRVQALRQMGGGLQKIYENWRERLLDTLAQIEGEIDFADEGDVPDALSHEAYEPLEGIAKDIESVLADMGRGAAIRSGLDVAIIGEPNVGKSTLMNALTKRDIAIVSPEAGTTRDVVDAQMVIGGLPVTLSDTAGLRDTDNIIEAEGVKRARKRAQTAAVILYVIRSGVSEFDRKIFEGLTPNTIIILNKTIGYDFLEGISDYEAIIADISTPSGVDVVYQALETLIKEKYSIGQNAGLTRARHGDCVRRAYEAIKRAQENLGFATELAGEDIRSALTSLSELAGESDIEQVFDRIFSRFCVGK